MLPEYPGPKKVTLEVIGYSHDTRKFESKSLLIISIWSHAFPDGSSGFVPLTVNFQLLIRLHGPLLLLGVEDVVLLGNARIGMAQHDGCRPRSVAAKLRREIGCIATAK